MEIVYMLELDFKKSENQFVYQNCMLKFAIRSMGKRWKIWICFFSETTSNKSSNI